MTTYLGTVSCDLHKCASRVRVSISRLGAIPLAVKASLNNFPRNMFLKGTTVEVEQCSHDGRKFRVTKVFEALDPTKEVNVNVSFNISAENAEAFRKGQTMPSSFTGKAMSHDRVRFFLNECYYNTGCKKDAMRNILKRAFDLGQGHSPAYMAGSYGGFYIICRPSQFARFMIYRNEAGQKNGFMDLQAKLYQPKPPRSPFDDLAEKTGVKIGDVMAVAGALNLSGCDVESALRAEDCDGPPEVDVSKNKYCDLGHQVDTWAGGKPSDPC